MKSDNRQVSYQAGFTLVEIMVGLAIGMLATLVIMQVFSVFESQKRVTTGTADAQTSGSIALYNIGRELQIAGYPLMPSDDSPLECASLTVDGTAAATNTLSPIRIVEGTSDTIIIHYGDSSSGGIPTTIGTLPIGNDVTVDNNFGCHVNDIALITNGTSCAMSLVTGPTDIDIPPVASTPPDLTTVTLQNTTGAVAGASLACLGNWNEITYAVSNGELTRNGVPVVAGIVNLQAQYGISTAANSNQVTRWVGTGGLTWSAPTVVQRNQIKAIRIAVVARNAKMESTNVTSACSSTTAATPTGLCAWPGNASSPAATVDLSADANWQRYRYRVYETIIPLRNMIWSKDTL